MAWTSPRTYTTGETITKSILDTHVRDNFNETAPAKVTTKGDTVFATAANTLTRLAVGADGDVLVSDSVATPGVRWSSTAKTAAAASLVMVNLAGTMTANANNDTLRNLRVRGVVGSGTLTGLTVNLVELGGSLMSKTGTGTIDTINTLYVDAATIATANRALYVATGDVIFSGTSGKVLIGDTSDANVTQGLTINQGAASNAVLAFKSSTTTHGMTSTAETDTFALFQQAPGLNGGLGIVALTDAAAGDSLTAAFYVRAVGVGATTATKTTAAGALIYFDGREKSGASDTGATANSNLLAVGTNGTTQFILDADGDSHQNIGTAWTNFDRENDIDLLNTLAAHVTRKDDTLRRGFGKWLREKRGRLEELKLVTFNRDGHHFVNMSRLTMLHTGALRELGAKLEAQAERLLQLEKKLLQLSA